MIEERFNSSFLVELNPKASIEDLLKNKLSTAYQKRLRFKDYDHGSRIFYGVSDGLAGLIVDLFTNAVVVQINTAGIDRYRELIRSHLTEVTGRNVYFLDNLKYREKEFLPVHENEPVPDLHIEENGLKYFLRSEVMQKVGFYYDHRENRLALMAAMDRIQKKFSNGLDLFCYAGAWGMNALKASCAHVTFVDQGNFSEEISDGLKRNGFEDRGDYRRADVFKFLDDEIAARKTYDLILCDPPAFAKSLQQKSQALDGYSKLHRKVLKLASASSLIAFSSCTHYVTHEEFQKNILDAAHKENRKLQLVHCGMQGFDHPISTLDDRSNYIKSYFYLLES